jgi:hypothetical protein
MHTRQSLIVLLIAAIGPVASAGDQKPTEMIVIGTVHKGTPNFTKDHLLRILERLNPAVILFEVDTSFIDKQTSQLLTQYRKLSLEAEAVTAFQDKFHVPLRPYDIEGRNRIYEQRHYFELQKELSEALGDLARQNKLGPEAKILFEEVAAAGRIVDALAQDRPEVINSTGCDAAIEHKHKSLSHIRKIIELTPSLARFADHAQFTAEFWDKRNTTMAANILDQAKDFSGGRVVVLCGFEHRYYLRRLLKAAESKPGISLREFWSY